MIKKLSLGLLIAVMVFTLVGCEAPIPIKSYQDYKSDQDVVYVAFSKEGEENDPIDYQDIADYQSIYSEYNSRLMYNTLTDEQKQVYRILEYAHDNEYTSIFLDSRLVSNIGLSVEEILRLLAVDSPMVQQNYSCSTNDTGYTFSYLWGLLSFEIGGQEFTIEGFSHESMEKKKTAVSVAKEIVKTIPKNLNQLEQARFLFRYLTREVTYKASSTAPNEQNNLYDALVLRETQCDGYANAFSLMCAMANIPCAEKVCYGKQEDEVGHTWNVFCADGVWYNADLSLDADYADLHIEMNTDFQFGFSDARVKDETDFYERFPKCNTNLIAVDYMASSSSDSKLVGNIRNAFRKGKKFVYIGLEKGKLKTSDLQKIANQTGHDIIAIDDVVGDKNYYYIFKD